MLAHARMRKSRVYTCGVKGRRFRLRAMDMEDDIFPVRRPGAGTEAREKKTRQFSSSNAASLSPAARKRQIWFIYFIGFMVNLLYEVPIT